MNCTLSKKIRVLLQSTDTVIAPVVIMFAFVSLLLLTLETTAAVLVSTSSESYHTSTTTSSNHINTTNQKQNNSSTTNNSNNTNNKNRKRRKWKWSIQDKHPCTIEQVTEYEFFLRFGIRGLPSLYPYPIVIRNSSSTSTSTTNTSSSTFHVNRTLSKQQTQITENGKTIQLPVNFQEVKDTDWYLQQQNQMKPKLSINKKSKKQQQNHKQQQYQQQQWEVQQTERTIAREYFRYLTQHNIIISSKVFTKNFNVTLSSSNAYSEHRQIVSLYDYITNITTIDTQTIPTQLSNESWYLFGETYSPIWYTKLLQYYTIPYCHTCQEQQQQEQQETTLLEQQDVMDDEIRATTTSTTTGTTTNKKSSFPLVALSFGIGNSGSGVTWHTHGPGFSETIHGSKHWILYPPTKQQQQVQHDVQQYQSSFSNETATTKPNHPIIGFHKDQSSLQWMEYIYSNETILSKSKHPYECTIHPGDILYFPSEWWHATINLHPYTVFVSSFTTEHI